MRAHKGNQFTIGLQKWLLLYVYMYKYRGGSLFVIYELYESYKQLSSLSTSYNYIFYVCYMCSTIVVLIPVLYLYVCCVLRFFVVYKIYNMSISMHIYIYNLFI